MTLFILIQVKKLCPNDPDANKKLKECEKAVQKIRFEEAIATNAADKHSVADSIDYRTIGQFNSSRYCCYLLCIYSLGGI